MQIQSLQTKRHKEKVRKKGRKNEKGSGLGRRRERVRREGIRREGVRREGVWM